MMPRRRTASRPGGPGPGLALILGGVLLLLPGPVQARQAPPCPAAADPSVAAGWEAYQAGDMLGAGDLFRTVLSLCPTHPEGPTGLGYVALRGDALDEAEGWFRRALEPSPGSVDAHVGMGLVAWRRGDLTAVRERFRRVEQLDPGNDIAREYLARVAEGVGAPPRAGSGEASDTLLARADEAWRSGDPEGAEILYRQVLRDSPGNTTALHRVALAAAWSHRIDEGLALLDQLLVLEPGNVDARLDQARFLAWQGRHGEALLLLDSLATSHPRHPGVLEEMARVQGWAGLFQASLATYDLLLGIQPGEGSIRRDRARTLAWTKDLDAAVALWDSLLVEAPSDPEARMGRARALAHANRLDEALAGYADILRGDPGNREALRERGRTLAWAGRLVEAEELLGSASRATPTDLDARLLLSQVLQWQGRPAAALSVLREAEELAPGRGDVAERRQQLLLAFRPAVRSSISLESDSDENRMVTLASSSSMGFGGVWSLRGDVYHRWLEQPGLRRRAVGGQLGVTLIVDPGWSLALGAGRTGSDASPGAGSTALSFTLGSPPRHPVRLRTGWSRSALDATAALADRGVVVEGPELSVDWEGRAWSLAGSGSWSAFQGVQSNTRRSASLALSRGLPSGIRVGASGRVLGFSRDLAEGYFSPSRFQLVEGTVRWLREPGRWSLLLEGAAGFQRIREADPAGTLRISSRIAHRPAPGREFFLGAGISSAGVQSFASDLDYRYTALLAGVAWVF